MKLLDERYGTLDILDQKILLVRRNAGSSLSDFERLHLIALEAVKKYNLKYWISDIKNARPMGPEARKWIEECILPSAYSFGVEKGAMVADQDSFKSYYFEKIASKVKGYGIQVDLFNDLGDSVAWIKRTANQSKITK